MPETMLLRRLLLPELKFRRSWRKIGTGLLGIEAEKESAQESALTARHRRRAFTTAAPSRCETPRYETCRCD
jgi:hypothetical protein